MYILFDQKYRDNIENMLCLTSSSPDMHTLYRYKGHLSLYSSYHMYIHGFTLADGLKNTKTQTLAQALMCSMASIGTANSEMTGQCVQIFTNPDCLKYIVYIIYPPTRSMIIFSDHWLYIYAFYDTSLCSCVDSTQ